MITNFRVSNYRSIGDEQTISFLATREKNNRSLIVKEVAKDVFVNKIALFIGPNASGKSNILNAINSVFSIMSHPNGDKKGTIDHYIPFKMMENEPCHFSIDFYLEGIRYLYEVEFIKREILHESFYYVPTRTKALIYERKFVGDDKQPRINFGTTLRLTNHTKETLRENTFNNSSVLSSISKLSLKDDSEMLKKIVRWIDTQVFLIDGRTTSSGYVAELQKIGADEERKKQYIKLLSKADFNITDFKIIEPAPVKDEVAYDEGSGKEGKTDVIFTNHSENGDFETPLDLQSEGTLRFIELSEVIYNVGKGDYIYMLDELGNRLHYDLIVYFLKLFLYSAESSQLIFTTQSLLLMDEDLIRKDCLYLTEKSSDTASTTYERVSDFGNRKNISVFNAYRLGKLGAMPEVGSPYL